jgi:hypothetical protein
MAEKSISLIPGAVVPWGPKPGGPRRPGPKVGVCVAVAPSRHLRGFRGDNLESVRAGYWVRELRDALTYDYRSDAHLVTYVVEGARRQPRLNKCGLGSFPFVVRVESFFCDMDNPGHGGWEPAHRRRVQEHLEGIPMLSTAGLYFTRRGLRLVQPLAVALPVVQAELALARWLAALEVAGVSVDWNCRDWTRHFRLPNVVRDGRFERASVLSLERMRPIEVAVPEEEPAPTPPAPRASGLRLAEPRAPRYGAPREALEFDWTTKLDPSWMGAIDRIACAVRQVETEWHALFLAIAGALLARGAEPEDLPLLCRAISVATGADDRPDDRELIGRSTAERAVMGLPVAGLSTLRRRWPVVAAAFEPVAPLRFRELTALLQAVGGSQALAARVGVAQVEVRGWLRGEPVRVELRAVLRSLLPAQVLDSQAG